MKSEELATAIEGNAAANSKLYTRRRAVANSKLYTLNSTLKRGATWVQAKVLVTI